MSDETLTTPRSSTAPLLGEWACLGVLYGEPAHGWAVASALRPDAAIGRIWTLSRPLTYRSLAQLADRGWIEPRGEEPGEGGPNRTVLAATRSGRARFRSWVRTPVEHVRDVRAELLLKLVFAERHGIDVTEMIERQRALVAEQATALGDPVDLVAMWRSEAIAATERFLERIAAGRPHGLVEATSPGPDGVRRRQNPAIRRRGRRC
jgi:DNA-binding PadR family transcriptional regulator